MFFLNLIFCLILTLISVNGCSDKKNADKDNMVTTCGNWSYIDISFNPYNDDLFYSSIPMILDKFEKEHLNLNVKHYDFVYNDSLGISPCGLLIRHNPK